MFFLGYNFLGADETAIPISPVVAKDNTAIEVGRVMLDTLAATKKTQVWDETKNKYVDAPLSSDIPTEWDWDTIMLADFNNNTLAGNVRWDMDTLTQVAIKRRVVGDYNWVTIAVKDIQNVEDLNISGTDITAENLEYEYAIVPILYGIEGEFSSIVVDVTNSDLVLIDSTGIYHTPLTDGFCDTTDVHPNSVLELLHNRYPTVVRNTIANYETITVNGNFVPFDDDNTCSFEKAFDDSPQGDRLRVLYSRKVKDFLTNGRTKILKNVDGQCWLVYVTTPPTDTADGYYNIRKLSFGCTEVGSLKKEEDLYYAGLLDVPEEFWSQSS